MNSHKRLKEFVAVFFTADRSETDSAAYKHIYDHMPERAKELLYELGFNWPVSSPIVGAVVGVRKRLLQPYGFPRQKAIKETKPSALEMNSIKIVINHGESYNIYKNNFAK